MTKCAACIEWEAKGGTVLQCNTCGQPAVVADENKLPDYYEWLAEVMVNPPTPNDALRELLRTAYPWPNTSQQPKPVKPQLSEKQEREGQGIARAVQNLNDHEKRLGASRWHP
jgi:hypothetical protein